MELSEFEQAKIDQKLDYTRVNLYYNRFKYRVKVKLRAVHYFRYCKNNNDVYERLVRERFGFSTGYHRASSLMDELKQSSTFSDLVYYDFVNWRTKNTSVKITVSANTLDCYLSDLDELVDLIKILPSSTKLYITYVEPVANYKAKTVYHKFPVHKFRIYFKTHRIEGSDIAKFKEFIATYNNQVSPALKSEIFNIYNKNRRMLRGNYVLLLPHYYVDVDHEHDILLWSLRYPDLIRTVFNIEKR